MVNLSVKQQINLQFIKLLKYLAKLVLVSNKLEYVLQVLSFYKKSQNLQRQNKGTSLKIKSKQIV